MLKIICLLVLCLSISCARRNKHPDITVPGPSLPPKACWDEEKVNTILQKLTSVSTTMNDNVAHKLELKVDTCKKRKYSIGNSFIILVNGKNGISGKTLNIAEDPKLCMERALDMIRELKSDVDDKIIKIHQQMHADQWADIDLSPVGWLNCNGTQNQFDDSVATLLHELNHQIRLDDMKCMYVALSKKYLCFQLPKILPLRSYGKLESFSTDDENAIKALNSIQQIYLTNIDEPFFLLLDELNAYTLTNFNYHEFLRKFPQKRFFDIDGKRTGVFSPLFYKITVNYLSRLQKENKKLYMEAFLINTMNRSNIKELLFTVRKTYLAWQKYLKARKLEEKPFEKKLFDEAQAIEATLKL